MSCDSLMPFNCCEFTVAYLRWLSLRTASTALTPLGDVPFPLNRRIGGESFDVGGAQAVRASAAMHEMSWMLRFFTPSITPPPAERIIGNEGSTSRMSRACSTTLRQMGMSPSAE